MRKNAAKAIGLNLAGTAVVILIAIGLEGSGHGYVAIAIPALLYLAGMIAIAYAGALPDRDPILEIAGDLVIPTYPTTIKPIDYGHVVDELRAALVLSVEMKGELAIEWRIRKTLTLLGDEPLPMHEVHRS